MVYSDPNNTNSIVYQHTLLSYQLKTSPWHFSRAATLHLYNMADRGEKLQQLHCYHLFSDSRDTYLTKNHHENYSPKMVPTNPTGSWTTRPPTVSPVAVYKGDHRDACDLNTLDRGVFTSPIYSSVFVFNQGHINKDNIVVLHIDHLLRRFVKYCRFSGRWWVYFLLVWRFTVSMSFLLPLSFYVACRRITSIHLGTAIK